MRVGHLLIYALVLLGRWVVIVNMEVDEFNCADVVSYFSSPAKGG